MKKRLIDANALKERAIRVSTVKEHCYFKAVGTGEIDKAPTVDAVEVVRCEYCKHYIKSMMLCMHGEGMDTPDKTDFCSHGDRKDDAKE